ncbi:NADH-dependent flavin oxidoreductase [Photobacterium galatheae]|uniref:NADH:flavin oxidoreductase n=1 Tax=Photobacterium galatheae TaxID=1654360 RepID=A0A066RZV5_9GAMM|nr:NADH-dependent flavin oxidoreductase [Photobacterium galatheae]KDM92928.1 NADH:flavin oxidoreductase [Photobacterium galatheae]
MSEQTKSLFSAFDFQKHFILRNRVALAPMTTWSSNVDGTISEQELAYYRRRVNGVGLAITGCSHVMANGIGFTDEFAAWDDYFLPSLTRLADAAKSGGAPAVLQLFHAGNKAVPELTPKGEIVSASELAAAPGPFNTGQQASRALSDEEIHDVIQAFGEATRRAIEAGFDGIELHGAHGFLIQNFFSPHYNQRTDAWGGSLENRMRFPLAVVDEVQRVVKQYAQRPFLVGYRISLEEAELGGLRIGDSFALINRLIEQGISYLHVSLKDLLADKPMDDRDGLPTASLVAAHVNRRVPVIAAGQINRPEQAEQALQLGVDMVAIGRSLVINPEWVEMAQGKVPAFIRETLPQDVKPDLTIPDKLWQVIEQTPGWFPLAK